MQAWLLTILVASPALAGCLAPTATDAPDAPDTPASPEWPFVFDATCDDATIAFLDDLERLQGLLPPGFTVADAAAFLESPTPTGRGLIAITTAECAESSLPGGAFGEAEVAILVEPPRVEGAEVESGAAATTYMAAVYISSEPYHGQVAPWGHDILVAAVSNEVADPPQSGPMTIAISDGEGEVARFAAALPARQPTSDPEFTNNWQATNAGLLHYRIDLAPRDFGTGAPVDCSIREGSRMHALFGFTDCAGRTGLAVGETGDPYRGAWTHFPGAAASGRDA